MSSSKKPFHDHLHELRNRLFICIGSVIAGTIIAYIFRDTLLALLIHPLGKPLYYTSPAGGLDFILKVCVFVGCVISIPVFSYNVLQFFAPLIGGNSTFFIAILLLASCILSLLGMSFAYFLTLPAAFQFLEGFNVNHVQSLISAQEYFSFTSKYIAGFGFLFQLPLIMLIIHFIHPLRPKQLLKHLRIVIVVSFIISAFLTPTPDIFNQLIMALPLILLYLLSILLIWFTYKH